MVFIIVGKSWKEFEEKRTGAARAYFEAEAPLKRTLAEFHAALEKPKEPKRLETLKAVQRRQKYPPPPRESRSYLRAAAYLFPLAVDSIKAGIRNIQVVQAYKLDPVLPEPEWQTKPVIKAVSREGITSVMSHLLIQAHQVPGGPEAVSSAQLVSTLPELSRKP